MGFLRKSYLCLKIVFALIILFEYGEAQAPANMTITLNTLGSCNFTSLFVIGSLCQLQMIIMVPANQPTSMHVELFTSDNSSNVYAILCKPSISVGANYNITTSPIPDLSSSLGDSRFDQAVLEFGTIQNSGSSTSNTDNSIIITFNVVVIDNLQTNGTNIWVTAGAEYYNGSEIWIGQASLTYATSTATAPAAPTLGSNGTSTAEIGKFGYFTTNYTYTSRYHSLTLTAWSTSTSLTVCSVHIMGAGLCYTCLDSVKAYVFSTVDKITNTATLSLGFVPNSGLGNTNANNSIIVYVAYKVSPNATANSTGSINLRADIGFNSGTNLSVLYGNKVTFNTPSDETSAPTPTLTATVTSTPVPIFQPFNITLNIDLPSNFNNLIQIDVIPNQDVTDNSTRVKICSVAPISSGENIGCPKCILDGYLYAYSQNPFATPYDSISWSIGSVLNYNLRTNSDGLYVNNLNISIIGQVLNHTKNVNGAVISIPIGVTFGNDTIWVGEANITVGGAANFSNTTDSLPTFAMSIADNKASGSTANIRDPRAVYFDIYTQPGSVYMPMNVEIVMPETVIGSNIPAATVCSVKVLYAGIYAGCVQPSFINEQRISYYQRMIRFENDKAILQLDALCNSADPTLTQDPLDGSIRFLIYFQLTDDPSVPIQNYIAVGVQYTLTQIYVGQLLFVKGTALPSAAQAANSVYSYATNSSISVNSGSFGVSNFVMKINPSTLAGYNFINTLTSAVMPGNVSFCSLRILNSGKNVPCSNPLNHTYGYSNYIKISDTSNGGAICSINNQSTNVSRTPTWDDDSVLFELITRPSKNAVGSYSLNLLIKDSFTSTVTVSNGATFTFNIQNVATSTFTPNAANSNSTIYGVDPSDPSLIFVNKNYLTFYPGQTSIIRFNMTLNESKSYYLAIQIDAVNSATTQVDLQKFFLSDIGDNYPCISMSNLATTSNNGKTIYLDIGDIAFYPIDPTNLTASTLTFEAFVRVPTISSITQTSLNSQSYIITVFLDGISSYSFLNEAITGFSLGLLSGFNSSIPQQNLLMSLSVNTTYPQISKIATYNITLTIPPFSNLRTRLFVSLVDNITGQQFGHINRLKVVNAGRNVDGLLNECNSNQLSPTLNTTVNGALFYSDYGVYDFGVITNTAYTMKLGTYVPFADDQLTIQLDVLAIDDPISLHQTNFSFNIIADFNLNSTRLTAPAFMILTRTGNEKPVLNLNSSFVESTTVPFSSNQQVSITFYASLDSSSTAEAYNVTIIYYLPSYVAYNSITISSVPITATKNDTAVYFNFDRLRFGQVVSCTFKVTIDPNSNFQTIMNLYGSSPSTAYIPFNAVYYKYYRSTPSIDSNNLFYTNLTYITYTPQTVAINSIPNNPLISSTLLCPLTSSVASTNPTDATATGWVSGYRSVLWYSSGATYIQASFKSLHNISRVVFSQLSSNTLYTPFSAYKISFSSDGISYAIFPEITVVSPALGSSDIEFKIPNQYITCRFIRIHITNVATPSDLLTKQTGLIIKNIYGAVTTDPSPISCPIDTSSGFYSPRSILYVPQTTTFFVCDENTDRSSSECYSSTDSAQTDWTVLPKIVSTIVFWVRDLDVLKDYLYAVGNDKVNYLRSDDNGLNWKAISSTEFNTIKTDYVANPSKYLNAEYQKISIATPPSVTIGPWSIGIDGVKDASNTLRFDWWNN